MEESIVKLLEHTLSALQGQKPNDRSDIDRWYAIVITDIEKVLATYKQYIKDE